MALPVRDCGTGRGWANAGEAARANRARARAARRMVGPVQWQVADELISRLWRDCAAGSARAEMGKRVVGCSARRRAAWSATSDSPGRHDTSQTLFGVQSE